MKAYSVPGFTHNTDLNIVYEWAKTVPENGVIVEIGSLFGRTAVAFAEGAHTSVKIYCIDYFDRHILSHPGLPGNSDFWKPGNIYDKEIEFNKFTKEYKNIIPLKLEKNEIVYPYNGDPIDILFLDCAHRNPEDISNILYFKKYMKPGGLICGHDYNIQRFPDVVKNTVLLEKIYNTTITLYGGSSMWSLRLK